jgi:hypothetical protein
MMIWGETHKVKWDRLTSWRKWFAWFPVGLADGRTVWLENFERKLHVPSRLSILAGCYPFMEYRMLESPTELPPPADTPTP